MWTYNYNELYHHGVPGMKWGIRKVRYAIGGRVTNGSNTLGSVIRNIARKKHIYSVGTHRREKFTNIARAVPKSPILGNRIKSEYGANSHHVIEAIFKAVAHALKIAVSETTDGKTFPCSVSGSVYSPVRKLQFFQFR